MFHESTSSESHMNDDTAKPVPPLTAKTADGKLYTRFADVEAEIREVWCRPPLGWIALKEKLKNETLVFLIRKSGLKDDYIRGHLQAELNARTIRISESHVKGFDDGHKRGDRPWKSRRRFLDSSGRMKTAPRCSSSKRALPSRSAT